MQFTSCLAEFVNKSKRIQKLFPSCQSKLLSVDNGKKPDSVLLLEIILWSYRINTTHINAMLVYPEKNAFSQCGYFNTFVGRTE